MSLYKKGQRIRIIKGTYAGKGYGTYLREAGQVSCCVKVDNDSVQERTIRLTSIEPMLHTRRTSVGAAAAGACTEEEIRRMGGWRIPRNTSDKYTDAQRLQEELEVQTLEAEVNVLEAKLKLTEKKLEIAKRMN